MWDVGCFKLFKEQTTARTNNLPGKRNTSGTRLQNDDMATIKFLVKTAISSTCVISRNTRKKSVWIALEITQCQSGTFINAFDVSSNVFEQSFHEGSTKGNRLCHCLSPIHRVGKYPTNLSVLLRLMRKNLCAMSHQFTLRYKRSSFVQPFRTLD